MWVVHGKGWNGKIWEIIFTEPSSFSISPKNKEKEKCDLCAIRMGLHRSIHVACRKTINILTLEVGEGYL